MALPGGGVSAKISIPAFVPAPPPPRCFLFVRARRACS